MPYLTVDGIQLPQSVSIARFVAKRCLLAGANDLEQPKADAVVDTVIDLQNEYIKNAFAKTNVDKEAAMRRFMVDELPVHLEKIEKLIKLYGSRGFSVGSLLKWSDLAIFNVTFNLQAQDSKCLDKFPLILGVKHTVESIPAIAEYVKTRPKTPF
jgi:hypothetical protein